MIKPQETINKTSTNYQLSFKVNTSSYLIDFQTNIVYIKNKLLIIMYFFVNNY